MSELETLLRSGRGPSCSTTAGVALAEEDLAGEADAEVADAAVTATVCADEGWVHCTVVTTLPVAVSCTELTEVASAATAIWA
jgi:hypothetical protein